MLRSDKENGIQDPWEKLEKEYRLWMKWWKDKIKARGQVPSEMFLWYLVARNHDALNKLLATPDQMKHLKIAFRGSTEEALDIYCAQLRWTDEHDGQNIFPTGDILQEQFDSFASWMHEILYRSLSGISVDKYKQLALVIAALVVQVFTLRDVSNDAWDALGDFIRTPRKASKKWLKEGYSEQKGRWGGEK